MKKMTRYTSTILGYLHTKSKPQSDSPPKQPSTTPRVTPNTSKTQLNYRIVRKPGSYSNSPLRASIEELDENYSPISNSNTSFLALMPEVNLWCEVIFRAINDIEYYLNAPRKNRESYYHAVNAKAWILSRSEDPQSFFWCLHHIITYDGTLTNKLLHGIRKKYTSPIPKPNQKPFNTSSSKPKLHPLC